MAYVSAWTTKEEVLKDIAKASGRKVRNRNDLDEGYLVVGDAPPPVMPEDEDAEMKLLFGDTGLRCLATEEDATPDLAGIQQMIRMIQDNNIDDEEMINEDTANDHNYFIAISKVSTLNPNVKEFKPKLMTPSRELDNKDINSNVLEQTVEASQEAKKEDEVKGNGSGDGNDVKPAINVNKKEYEQMARTLKNQISDAAKSDSFELKKQKNVAIATLLKLYAKNNTPSPTSTVKLITPDYFESKVARKEELRESQPGIKIVSPVDIAATDTSSTPEPRESSTTLPSCSTTSLSSSSTNVTIPIVKLDPVIKKSIDKVNRWLEEPTKRKSPAVCLGPIAFKRKEPVNSKSPVSDSAPQPKPVAQSQRYQPSKYAADLSQKYQERKKELDLKKSEVTWTNLEEVLKAKDIEIKRRQEQEQASTSGS